MVAKSTNRTDNEDNVFVNNSQGNVAKNVVAEIDTTGTGPIPVDPTASISSPTIYNITIGAGDVGVEQSQALANGTRKIFIKHRDTGNIDFSFTTGLATYINIPKGSAYDETGLNLQGQTLYLETDKQGVIEIITWT